MSAQTVAPQPVVEPRAQSGNLVLEARRIHKVFGGLVAVNNLSFSVFEGEILSIIGPNGAGKTTVFNLLTGVLPLDGGEIWFRGRKLNGLPPHAIARLGMARTFQTVHIFENMTVLENVMIGRHPRSRYGFVEAAFQLPWARKEEQAIRQHAMACLELVGIADLAGELAGNLPFGQQRLVELARALATEPTCLLLDEPASGLSHQEVVELDALIRRLRDEQGITVLLIEHDMNLVMGIADRIVVINYGEKIAEGAPEEIQQNERVIAAYLGEDV